MAISLALSASPMADVVWDHVRQDKTEKHYNVNGIDITVKEIDRMEYESRMPDISEPSKNTVRVIPSFENEEHTLKWIQENLYKVEAYTPIKDSNLYEVQVLHMEPAIECSFEELKEIFNSTEYADENSYYLDYGVNCQGMTCYIVDWCIKNQHEFSIEYFKDHIASRVLHEGVWYRFNFTRIPEISEVTEDN